MADKIMVDAIDASAELANAGQTVEIYHIPSKYSVIFKAMMTQFEDAYTSNWTSEQAYGRMDPLQTYQNTSRVISMGFDVVAASINEAHDNLRKISSFAQFLYPTYDAEGLIGSSPFCRIQFMNWSMHRGINNPSRASQTGLMGTINGFTFAPDLDVGVFSSGGKLYPKKLNVSFSFTVLHNHALGWGETDDGFFPRSGASPYGEIVVNNNSEDETETFDSKIGSIQTTEVPIDVRAEAIKKDLLNDATAGESSYASFKNNNINRSAALRKKNEAHRLQKVRESAYAGKGSALGGGSVFQLPGNRNTFFNNK